MKASTALVLLASAVAEAHYKFPALVVGGARTTDWEVVRKTANYQSNGPVTDVTSKAMTCYELAGLGQTTKTINVTAGSTIGYVAEASVSHPGPMSFWMAKVPAGQTAATYDGSGPNWFKVYQDYPSVAAGLTWPTQGKQTINMQIPKCLADGEYLLRGEHIALHSASSVGGAQLYISCAQVSVSGGSGTYKPSKTVSIPGVYSPTDPGLVVNIYYPVPTNYKPPGPEPLTC